MTEWSRTATQQTRKKSSVTRLTSLQSSESNNTSGSSSCLVSDSSDQSNGISKWQTTPSFLEHTHDLIFSNWDQEFAQKCFIVFICIWQVVHFKTGLSQLMKTRIWMWPKMRSTVSTETSKRRTRLLRVLVFLGFCMWYKMINMSLCLCYCVWNLCLKLESWVV